MSFLYPGFLWALSALAIPIIIHLFNFRRPTKAVFTNVSFLREVKNTTNKSRKLKHLLVLLCRLIALAFLVFLFAQPFIPAKNKGAVPANHFLLYLDNSFSMQAGLSGKGNENSIFTNSVNGLLELANTFPRGAEVSVIDNSFSGSALYSSQDELKQKLSGIDLTGNLRRSESVLSRVNSSAFNPSTATAFFFSDFQKSTFNPAAFAYADSLLKYNLIHLAAENTKNLYIDSVEIEDAFIRFGENNSVAVIIRNTGNEEVATNVKFFMGNQQVSTLDVQLAPASTEKVKFSFRLPDNTEQLCRIVLEDFPVTFDNEYFFTLQASPEISIINISNSVTSPVTNVYSNEPVFRITSTDEAKVNYEEVAKSNLIVIYELSTINPAFADNVIRQAENGASVLLIPSGNPDKESYQAFFNRAKVKSASLSNQSGKIEVSAPDLNNPFFQKIFDDLPKGVETPQAKPILTWSRAESDILKFRQGSPFLSQFRVGKGNLFVLASPLGADYSDFASNALFVPVFYKLAMMSQQASSYSAYSFSHNVLEIPLNAQPAKEQVFKLLKDSVEWTPDQRLIGNRLIITVPGELAEAGFYQLAGPGGKVKNLAFNYDKRESQLEQYSADDLKKLMEPYKNVTVHEASSGADFAKQYREQNEGKPLWIYCLIICLLALAAETAIIRFVK